MVKAIRVHQTGGPEALIYEDVELAAPGPGEVQIRQHAVGVNFLDVYFRTMSQQAGANETFKREKFLVLLAELFPAQREEVEKYMQGSEKGVIVQTKPG